VKHEMKTKYEIRHC